MANRLKQVRKTRKLTQAALGLLVNTSQQQIFRLEKGTRRMTFDWADRLARAMAVKPAELIGDERLSVPIVGRVVAGARIEMIPLDDRDAVECPEHLDPATTAAVEIQGDALLPIPASWLVFYSRGDVAVPTGLLGTLCVVKIGGNGPTLIRELRRGYSWGRYNLVGHGVAPIDDVELESAALIRGILPRESHTIAA